jgi:hypothetical protein
MKSALEQSVDLVGMAGVPFLVPLVQPFGQVHLVLRHVTTSLACHGQHWIIRKHDTNAIQTSTERLKILSLSSARAW